MNRSRALTYTIGETPVLVVNDSAPEELDEHLAILRGMSVDYGARLCVVEWREATDPVADTLPPPRPPLPTVPERDDRAVLLGNGTVSGPEVE